MKLDVQIYLDGAWQDAAQITLEDPSSGRWSPSVLEYDTTYFVDFASEDMARDIQVADHRAVSVAYPVDMTTPYSKNWPGFLADMLPQGNARTRMLETLGLEDIPASDVELLMRTGGSPVGNIRIREAHELAIEAAERLYVPSLTDEDIFSKNENFREVSDKFAFIASGSKGLQGEWPKIALTQDTEGNWYPDPLVDDAAARKHVIVKLLKSDREEDLLILQSEAAYIEIAREFGLNVGLPLDYRNGVLMIPRFDRDVMPDGVVRFGQESIYSAMGIVDGSNSYWTHEGNIAALVPLVSDPAAFVSEYVLRDVLNIALGNPDNHGRNTALQKARDFVSLSPVFDLAPMKLAPEMINRTTKWNCMREVGSDYDPDWNVVCETVCKGIMDPQDLVGEISGKAEFVRGLPSLAAKLGVPERVIDHCISGTDELADKLEGLTNSAVRGKKWGG